MRLLVCGGRDFADAGLLAEALRPYRSAELLIHGFAPGADALAAEWACRHRIPVVGYVALWTQYGNAAGPIRNQQMLDEGKPDIVVAFPGGPGTANMIKRARRAGIQIVEIATWPTTSPSRN